MSDHDEEMNSLGVITNIVQNVENRLKVIQQLRDKYRAEVQKLKQECCLAKSASTDKVRKSEENIIRLLNLSETIKSGNIELEKKLLLLKNENERKEKLIANLCKLMHSIKYDNHWNEIEKKLEPLPHYRELKVKKNEIEQLKDSVNNLELKAVTLREENSKKKAQIWKTDRDYIIKLAEFMVARKKKYEETVARNKRISHNDSLYKSETVDKNTLVMPVTPYKFQENVKKALLKDCTEVEVKDTIYEFTGRIMKRLQEIIEENDKSETAFNYDNIAKRKRSLNDKEINEECSKKQVIEIIEDVKVDKKCTNSLLSGVNVKETNEISEKVQANTFSADAEKSSATNKFRWNEFEDDEMKDEENVAKEEANINEQDAADSAVNKETVVIPKTLAYFQSWMKTRVNQK